MIRSLPFILTLFASNIVHAETLSSKVDTREGLLTIETVLEEGNPVYGQQTYAINDKKLGTSMLYAPTAELIGSDKNAVYVLVKGGTGGSGCLEVMSVVRISEGNGEFSEGLTACGGLQNVEFDDGVTTLTVLERDERTKTIYQVIDSKVIENGKVKKDGFSFLE